MKKLVRDKIPEIIESEGQKANAEIIQNDQEYCEYLKKKLQEEVEEYIEAISIDDKIEELADIFEVIDSLCAFDKIDKNVVNELKIKKFKERGGFSKKILLVR